MAILAAILLLGACSSNSTVTLTDAGETADDSAAAPEPTEVVSDEPAAEAPTAAPTAEPAEAPTAAPTAEPTEAPNADTESDATFSGADSGNFCAIARELDENNPFDDPDLAPFSEAFFEATLDFYSQVEAIAPDEVRADFVLIRMGLEQLAAAAEQYDYNLFDPGLGQALEAIDTAEFDAASMNIETYLLDVCGIDITSMDSVDSGSAPEEEAAPPALPDDMLDAFGGIDLESLTDADIAALSQLLFSQFAADPELQACLLENIDVLLGAAEDPSILTREFCGTTLLDLFSGAGG